YSLIHKIGIGTIGIIEVVEIDELQTKDRDKLPFLWFHSSLMFVVTMLIQGFSKDKDKEADKK
uniref:Uncharacterized protein n=1 Tax=Lutzomyia longipalpis TaxID=7200 RepID=A0A1B0GIZ3_LUTLO